MRMRGLGYSDKVHNKRRQEAEVALAKALGKLDPEAEITNWSATFKKLAAAVEKMGEYDFERWSTTGPKLPEVEETLQRVARKLKESLPDPYEERRAQERGENAIERLKDEIKEADEFRWLRRRIMGTYDPATGVRVEPAMGICRRQLPTLMRLAAMNEVRREFDPTVDKEQLRRETRALEILFSRCVWPTPGTFPVFSEEWREPRAITQRRAFPYRSTGRLTPPSFLQVDGTPRRRRRRRSR